MTHWMPSRTVFDPRGRSDWMQSHAQLPTPLRRDDGSLRVFFAARDDRNRSSVGFVDLDPATFDVVRVAEEPVLSPGPLGCFDDHGVYPASVVRDGGRIWLYYIGWNPGPRQPLFYSSIGLACSDDDGDTFQRASVAPIMARSEHDPCLVTSPCVLKEGDSWRMWYVSGVRWDDGDTPKSYYHVKYAESDDGRHWRRDGRVAIDFTDAEECNIARPCVVRDEDRYRMWFCSARGADYRLGYAESRDGLVWDRNDELHGFGDDDVTRAYPWVCDIGDYRAILFNGAGFGRDGFQYALAREDGSATAAA